jgi:hypothetical protein
MVLSTRAQDTSAHSVPIPSTNTHDRIIFSGKFTQDANQSFVVANLFALDMCAYIILTRKKTIPSFEMH